MYIYIHVIYVCVRVCVCVCIHMCIIKIKFGEVQLKNTEELNCKIVISPELIVKVILVGFIWRKAILMSENGNNLLVSIEANWLQLLCQTFMMGMLLDDCNNKCKDSVTLFLSLHE